METTAAPSLLPHLWKSTLLSGILAVILGILILAWPGKTLFVAAIFFGAYLLITGISQVFFAFSLDVSAGGRVLLFISGAAALILAVLCFRSLQESDAVAGHLDRRRASSSGAWRQPFRRSATRRCPGAVGRSSSASISLLAGVVMLASPFESIATLTLVVGIWLIVIGVFEVVSAFGIRECRQEGRERRRGNPRRRATARS